MTDMTNFYSYSHGQMRSMVQSMDSGAVMAAADPWRRATDTLKQIRTALNTAAADTSDSWQGDTSNAFYSHMTTLANDVNTIAAYSNDAASALEMMSAAIDKAKSDMPEEPGFWDKVGDAIGDSAQQTVGIDNEDTRTAIADTRKQEAVTVMQTLAASYRATTSYLKPPKPKGIDDSKELQPPDNGGASALGALIMGVGAGLSGPNGAGAGGSSGSRTSGQRSMASPTPQAPKLQPAVVRPTDAGISGGTANPVPQPKGPGTNIDGIQGGNGGVRGGAGTIGGTGGTSGVHGPSGGSGLGPAGGVGGGLIGRGEGGLLGGGSGIGGSRAGFSGNSVSKAGTFGSSGLGGSGGPGGAGAGGSGFGGRAGGGLGAGGGAGGSGIGARSGGNLTGKAGGAIGESTHATAGGRAFTEGGSGIGRNRFGQGGAGGQAGGPGQTGAGHGGGAGGHGQAGKKDKKRGKDRPDYLVEDEETWASGQQANPNVVE
ncbi:WXG100 family type VII secretion target [Kitasatospora sp. NPDC048407]|uniref:WXG100 family type VII secretion target n=1 Tax=Kitasatospora sp. NPDC048407 TaxID=3364051 RepID=UPI00371CF03A